ncbi:MAG: RNA polymerase sigma factor [Trichodesmium sp. MO_231.B1]|nr:RNA polymerase sigma factor [Trichodesmium sp. MO_231.B1]
MTLSIFPGQKIPDIVRSIPLKKLKTKTELDKNNLLKSISLGEHTAFWQLWLLYQDYLYGRCITWMGGDRTNAEEALSLARMKAWEKLPHYAEKITNPKAWLTRMTHNLCVDLHRKRHRSAMGFESIEEMAVGEDQTLASSENSPESAILRGELRMYIRRQIEALSPRLREPFILHFYQDMSYPDIAKKLDISMDNVYKRIQQGREILQKQLKQYLSGIDDSPLLLKEVGEDEILDEFQSEKSVIPSPLSMTTECNFEQINYQVTAICLETLAVLLNLPKLT